MSYLNKWNDLIALKSGDKISYKDNEYIILSKDIDQDYGGIAIIFNLNNNKSIKINHLGEIMTKLGRSKLENNELKLLSNGGKRKSRRNKNSKRSFSRKRGIKKHAIRKSKSKKYTLRKI
jgi:hypothetical protein